METSLNYDQVLALIKQLHLDEQRLLLESLRGLVEEDPISPQHSILELQGLGREIWQDLDTTRYIAEERDSWGG